MNYLVIDDELIYSALSPELKKLYDFYTESLKQRTEFEKLLSKVNSQRISIVWYKDECAKLAKPIKHMTFEKTAGKLGMFRIRPTYNGERISLGMSANFDEACGIMLTFLESKIEDEKLELCTEEAIREKVTVVGIYGR